MRKVVLLHLVFIALLIKDAKSSYTVWISPQNSAVLGETVTLNATLYQDGKIATGSTYEFVWSDGHHRSKKIETNTAYSNWTLTFKKGEDAAGLYNVKIEVYGHFVVIDYLLASNSTWVNVTVLLSGQLVLTQNGTERKTEYISSLAPVNHTIQLTEGNLEFLRKNATYLNAYWFKNCQYLGQSSDISFMYHYNKENEEYDMEVLLVASFEKLPEPTTTTTTTTTTTATTTTTTTATTTKTPTPPTPTPSSTTSTSSTEPTTSVPSVTTPHSDRKQKRSVENLAEQTKDSSDVNLTSNYANDGNAAYNMNSSEVIVIGTGVANRESRQNLPRLDEKQPYVCSNRSLVVPDPKKSYGHFSRRIIAKRPIMNVTVTGSTWLQHSDVLKLVGKCEGSIPLSYCVIIIKGQYNVTGNETCPNWIPLDSCNFSYQRYFSGYDILTVLFVINNPISNVVKHVAINYYQATKQSQLSVIVVPVSFCLIAVICVVFGVAYYIQNQNRFIVEVADFNFGETQSADLEYKTFQQRLIDSIQQTLRRPQQDSSQNPGTSTDSNLKYGSMT